MKPRLIAVIGRQRSGTTVLRQFIGSSPRSFDVGEVFHALTDRETSFWGFLYKHSLANTAYRFPLAWIEAWKEFIGHQSELFPSEVFTFDVKVEYFPIVLRTNGISTDFFFDDPSIAYVYLRRRNTAAQIISRHVAAATNVWSQIDPDGDPGRLWRRYQIWGGAPEPKALVNGLTMDPDELLREIAAVRQQDEAIDRVLSHKFSLRLTYEDLFERSGTFTEQVTTQIAQLSGVPFAELDRRPILLKQRKDGVLREIKNAAEILSSFKGTDYQWMLEEH